MQQKVRAAVDKVGPQVFKNFDKMRLIMFDPTLSQRGSEKKAAKKAGSFIVQAGRDTEEVDVGANPKSTAGEMLDKPLEFSSERRASFDYPKSMTDYDLDYLEELELNRAFSIIKDL